MAHIWFTIKLLKASSLPVVLKHSDLSSASSSKVMSKISSKSLSALVCAVRILCLSVIHYNFVVYLTNC